LFVAVFSLKTMEIMKEPCKRSKKHS